MAYRPAVTAPPHPARAVAVMQRIMIDDLAAMIGNTPFHVTKVLGKHYKASSEFRAAVAIALDLPESDLFDDEPA